ncbi:MAG: hypothetical protein GY757_22850, partial [bacterium]|nr:hypothetical protein [bacterium]
LLDAITDTKAAQDKNAFNQVIDDLIVLAGNPDGSGSGDVPSTFSWMQDDSLFNQSVSDKLVSLYKTADIASQHYVSQDPNVRNTYYGNERRYAATYPKENHRILALFRYWNIMEYFFPYKDIMDRDWGEVLTEYIPLMAAAESDTQYHLAIKRLTVQINDGHAFTYSSVLTQYFGSYYAPFDVRLVENQTVVSKLYRQSVDVQIGDIILNCRDMDIEDFRNQMYKYAHGSNEVTIQRNLNDYVVRGTESQMKFTISRNGEIMDIVVDAGRQSSSAQSAGIASHRGDSGDIIAESGSRYRRAHDARSLRASTASTGSYRILDGYNIGYVDMGLFKESDISTAMEAFTDTKAIIFDIRNYPEFLLYSLCPYLNPGPAPFVKFSYPLLTNPGELGWTRIINCSNSTNDDYYKGKVIILEDESTLSRAEFTVMALQTAPNSTIIGSQTAGADGNVSSFYLPGSIKTMFTGIGVFYPDGSPTQRIGIVPDIVARPTVAGIRAGRDEVLERAIEFIEND